MAQPIKVKGEKIRLREFAADDTSRVQRRSMVRAEMHSNRMALADLSHRLHAEHRRSVLLVLQGMDTAGKDGTIQHVMHGVNPQVCEVTSFKQPTAEEFDHDFLWRIHKAVPRKGEIAIFNRSHYEDVLTVRVHELVPAEIWRARFEQINEFERLVMTAGTRIVKCFLHISRDEQRKRLQERVDDPQKRWKFDPSDLAERKLWERYQEAYEDVLNRCSTKRAPWHIIPADHKWYRNLLVSRLLRKVLEKMDPQFPAPAEELGKIKVE